MPCHPGRKRASASRSTPPPHAPQHVRLDPLPLAAAGPEGALDQRTLGGQLVQRGPRVHAQPLSQVGDRERPVAAGVPQHQPTKRVGHRLQEGRRQPGRHVHAGAVPVEPGVLGGDQPPVAGDPHLDGAALTQQLRRCLMPLGREVAGSPQQIVQIVGR